MFNITRTHLLKFPSGTGDKSSPLGFMRADRVRVHVPTAALIEE